MMLSLLHRRRLSSGDAQALHGGGGGGSAPAGCSADNRSRPSPHEHGITLMTMIAG
jgi:hypothetical protein